jgi:hypothetical protein
MSQYYSKHVVTIFWHLLYYITSEKLKGRERERTGEWRNGLSVFVKQ